MNLKSLLLHFVILFPHHLNVVYVRIVCVELLLLLFFFVVAAINFIITLVCHCKVQKQHAAYIKTVSTKVNVNRCALHSGMTALLTNRTTATRRQLSQ